MPLVDPAYIIEAVRCYEIKLTNCLQTLVSSPASNFFNEFNRRSKATTQRTEASLDSAYPTASLAKQFLEFPPLDRFDETFNSHLRMNFLKIFDLLGGMDEGVSPYVLNKLLNSDGKVKYCVNRPILESLSAFRLDRICKAPAEDRASNGPYYGPYKVNRNGHVFSTNIPSSYDTYTYLSSSLSYERTQNLTRTGLKIAQSYSTTPRWKPWLRMWFGGLYAIFRDPWKKIIHNYSRRFTRDQLRRGSRPKTYYHFWQSSNLPQGPQRIALAHYIVQQYLCWGFPQKVGDNLSSAHFGLAATDLEIAEICLIIAKGACLWTKCTRESERGTMNTSRWWSSESSVNANTYLSFSDSEPRKSYEVKFPFSRTPEVLHNSVPRDEVLRVEPVLTSNTLHMSQTPSCWGNSKFLPWIGTFEFRPWNLRTVRQEWSKFEGEYRPWLQPYSRCINFDGLCDHLRWMEPKLARWYRREIPFNIIAVSIPISVTEVLDWCTGVRPCLSFFGMDTQVSFYKLHIGRGHDLDQFERQPKCRQKYYRSRIPYPMISRLSLYSRRFDASAPPTTTSCLGCCATQHLDLNLTLTIPNCHIRLTSPALVLDPHFRGILSTYMRICLILPTNDGNDVSLKIDKEYPAISGAKRTLLRNYEAQQLSRALLRAMLSHPEITSLFDKFEASSLHRLKDTINIGLVDVLWHLKPFYQTSYVTRGTGVMQNMHYTSLSGGVINAETNLLQAMTAYILDEAYKKAADLSTSKKLDSFCFERRSGAMLGCIHISATALQPLLKRLSILYEKGASLNWMRLGYELINQITNLQLNTALKSIKSIKLILLVNSYQVELKILIVLLVDNSGNPFIGLTPSTVPRAMSEDSMTLSVTLNGFDLKLRPMHGPRRILAIVWQLHRNATVCSGPGARYATLGLGYFSSEIPYGRMRGTSLCQDPV
ncbi:uncharacterized protein BDR25DRAFT_353515 [Lindgomyces ingoldianus]|uniref:Uncharacterized protein n=1 Tax=Lindgomyces ingoldianus TaxID=673940 RepID=A0ACB6QZM7_9PLEO|nr:uncharacterized protein BDR25DRAFT_353515 [Lindgomyces ingoldianus]KAF2472494.1 hypothetical protein BDR25DRAFT_353515 [Lindgomyces ingoldianus]